ncbi:MAG: hypothetical protein ABL872_06670 [Lacibacter sp.]
MKQLLPVIILLLSLAACRGSKYSTRSDEKDLSTLIKRLNKKGGDEKVIADLKEVYNNAYYKSAQRLENYRFDPAPQKWDKIVPELEGLQRMYETISQSAYALRMVNPINFYPQLIATKDSAAFDNYEYGKQQLEQNNREDSKEAYYAFQNSIRFVPNYKNAKQLMREAYERSIVNVLVNTIQYDDFGMGGNWGWNQYANKDRMTHSNILRDLGGQSASAIPARFYDEYALRRENRAPDLVVDLVWKNLRFDYPKESTRKYGRSKQIQTGTDTANRPIYKSANATVNVTVHEFTASGDMNLIVSDAVNRTQIKWDRLPSEYRYIFETATYEGDGAALTDEDRELINRRRNQPMPGKEDAMGEMMQKIYHDLVNRIRNAANW